MSQTTIRDQFFKWLSTRTSPKMLSDLFLKIDDIDAFCLKTCVLKTTLLETTDLKTISKVKEAVSHNKMFKFKHKKHINDYIVITNYYYNFIKNYYSSYTDDDKFDFKSQNSVESTVANTTDSASIQEGLKNDKNLTIKQAISVVLTKADTPLSAEEIYHQIVNENLYNFGAQNPIHVVEVIIERSCRNSNYTLQRDANCIFGFTKDNSKKKYFLLSREMPSETINDNDEHEEALIQVNFNSIDNYIDTSPVWFDYFGERINISEQTWKHLYIQVIETLFEDYEYKFNSLVGIRLANCGRVDFANEQDKSKLVSPHKLSENIYLETFQSNKDYIAKIKNLLDICLVDYENLIISYTSKTDNSTVKEELSHSAVETVENEAHTENNSIENDSYNCFNLENTPKLSFAKPISCKFEDGFILNNLKSWNQLYVEVLKELLKRFPQSFHPFINTQFPGTSKIEFANRNYRIYLRAARAIDTDLFVETHHSAITIVRRIKFFVQKCGLPLSSVTIEYTSEQNETLEVYKKPTKRTTQSPENKALIKAFFSWLLNEYGISESTSRAYTYNITLCENYMVAHHIGTGRLYAATKNEAKNNIEQLLLNQVFIRINSEQKYKYFPSLKKFVEFKELGEIEFPMKREGQNNTVYKPIIKKHYSEEIVYKYSTVLKEHFPKGYKTNSSIERKRFAKFFENQYNGETIDNFDEIDSIIRTFAFPYEDRVYHLANVLDLEVKKEIYNHIEKMLSTSNMLSVKQLFKQFEDELLFSNIKSESMLGALISFEDNDLYVNGEYISKSESNQCSVNDEIKAFMKEYIMPIKLEEVYSHLPQFPKESIRLEMSRVPEIILISKETHCYIDAFDISEFEISEVKNIISNAINQHGYISTKDLYKTIEIRVPNLLSKNDFVTTDYGLRNLLKYHLGDLYKFGSIITSKSAPLEIYDVYAGFCKNKKTLTINEIYALSSDLNNNICYEAIYDNAVRIDKDKFVSNDSITFDVDAIDEAISGFCENEYITIKDIPMFLSFPEVGYSWNPYLLENYIYRFSKRFKLIHERFNATVAIGAIVKKDSKSFSDYYEVIVDALAHSNIELNKDNALDFLCKAGYLFSLQYKKIDAAVHDAKNLRKTF